MEWPFARVRYHSREELENQQLFLTDLKCLHMAKLGSTTGRRTRNCVCHGCGHKSDYLSPANLHLETCTAFDSIEMPRLSLAARKLKK